jgi:hypothetical protein
MAENTITKNAVCVIFKQGMEKQQVLWGTLLCWAPSAPTKEVSSNHFFNEM